MSKGFKDGVAIVGFGAVFPGSPSARSFWRLVAEGIDATTEVPPGRWPLDPARAFDPQVGKPDHVYTTRGGFIDDEPPDLDGLDIDPALVARLDPVFRLALRAAGEAWRSARTETLDRSRVGIVFGNIVLPTETTSSLTRQTIGREIEESLGITPSESGEEEPRNAFPAGLPAELVARALGLGGVAFTLDAACASSLYALKLACDELLSGRADAMIAGGLSRPDALYTQMGFSQLRALSPRGRAAPFDAEGDGLIVGEGAGLFVLKRLEDAQRVGDEIHGVIRGIGLSNDIQGDVLAPSSEGQLRAMRAAYAQAGWSPADVDFIECHATGTPVGDSVEFESLKTLWSDAGATAIPRRCALGSVKSNVGHALTAAGAAGLLKVLLALRHQAIPPIANHAIPSPRLGLEQSPFRVLKQIEPWPAPIDRPRRAAISGFGFGGINAHVLIEEWDERADASAEPKPIAPPAREPVAVVGLAARFGRRDTEGFQHRALGGETDAADLALDELRVRLGRFRIPPRELEEMLLQQSLLLQVAADALAEARWSPAAGLRTSVLVGLGLDLNTTNYHLRWWLTARAPVWNEELGWGMSLEDLAAWIAEARDAIHPALSANRTMGSLGGLVASRIAREFRIGGPSFSVSSDENSGLDALRLAADWLARGEIDSAVVGAVDLAADPRLVQAARELLGDDFEPSEGAVALILKRQADAIRDGDRIHALVGGSSESPVLIDAPRGRIGWTGAAEGLAAVASAVLGLEHGIIPPEGRFIEASADGSPGVTRYWLRNRDDGPRRALVRARGLGGAERFVALEAAAETTRATNSRPLEPFPRAVFAARGDDAAQLAEHVKKLANLLADNADQSIDALARRWWRESRGNSQGRLGLALSADNAASLALALKAVGDDLRNGRPIGRSTVPGIEVFAPVGDWDVPPGVALAYPGLGNVFPGMGGELSALWPELLGEWEGRFETLRDQFAPEAWWNGPLPTRFDDHRPAILGQISVGALTTALFLKLGVKPMAAVGYSMGESAALVAIGAWPDRDEMTRRLLESPLFAAELAGPCRAARRAWGLADSEPVDWVAGIVPRSREEVEAAIGDESRVYVLIRNAADETVIGGRDDAVKRVVEALRCPFLPLPLVSTVHCPIGAEVEPAYRALHDQRTEPVPGIAFYSGVWGRSHAPDRTTAAEAITAQAAGVIDFPRVVEAAHADGARVFLEMGPGASCTRLIGRILGDRPHLAISANPGEGPALDAVLRAVGALIAAGVPVDLDFLYGCEDESRETDRDQKPSREIVIRRERVPNRPLEAPRPVRKAVPIPPPPPALAPVESTSLITAVLETSPSMSDPIHAPALLVSSAAGSRDSLPPLTRQFLETQRATADAHETFLRLAQSYSETMSRQVSLEFDLIGGGAVPPTAPPVEPPYEPILDHDDEPPAPSPRRLHPKTGEPIFLDRVQCLELAVGSIAAVLGPEFAEIDSHPTRVRLPDEPLMLVDRVVSIEGTLHSLTSGRVVTEHDVKPGAWYLDGGRIASCVAIESGQADLFLAGYLGIDFITKGLAVYRLLDATVTFHRSLPEPGATVRYDIKILNFFRQDETHLFRFEFTATIDGEPLLTMRDGCAGFFTAEELASGKGVVPRPLDARPRPGVRPDDWRDLAPPASTTLDRHQVEAIRAGNLFEAFGAPFDRLDVARPIGLPGGRMALVDRVVALESKGGRYGLGLIRAEADIHPDDWFLTCHFVDDRVMPGTLMYECCLHTMRILLMRMGWVGSADSTRFDPVSGVANRLRCRGQVIETTKVAAYEVTIKEIGYGPEPYAIADALMYADGKPIVEITDMALKLTGSSREELERLWDGARPATVPPPSPSSKLVYEKDQILAFATGAPSACFGDRYRPFDEGRFIARLPRPPYQFIDRATILEGAPWTQAAGTSAEVEYNIPPDAWYFDADRQPRVPYAVLLEAALQSCGFVSAFMGSALASDESLKFRNLGGRARQLRVVDRNSGTLRTTVRVTKVNRSAGMIIQNYEMEVRDRDGLVFEGDTYFGFFHPDALANQVGLREAVPYELTADERRAARSFPLPDRPPLPDRRWRMVEHVDALLTGGGPHGLGLIEGSGAVDPSAWFFEAHFLDDPVWPGSLGLESLLQLLKVFAEDRWGLDAGAVFDSPTLGVEHQWTYRGQIVSTNDRVTTQAVITAIDDAARRVTADGWLRVDGKVIYQMNGFSVEVGAR